MSRTRTQRLREHIIDQIRSGVRDKDEVVESVPAELTNLYDAPNALSGAVHAIWDSAMSEADEISAPPQGGVHAAADTVRGYVRDIGGRAGDALSQAAHRVTDRLPPDVRNITPKDPLPYILAGFGAVLAVALLCGNKRR